MRVAGRKETECEGKSFFSRDRVGDSNQYRVLQILFFFYSFILFIQPLFSDEKVKFTKANYNYDIKTMFTYLTEKLKTKNVKSFSNRIESKVEPIKSQGCNHMINVLIC